MLACLYNAALWSMLVCVALFQNTRLEMRVNLGFVCFSLIPALFAVQIFVRPLRRLCGTLAAATFSLIAVSAACLALLGTERLLIIPASIVREGLMMPRLPFDVLNFALDTFLVLGWLLIAVMYRERP